MRLQCGAVATRSQRPCLPACRWLAFLPTHRPHLDACHLPIPCRSGQQGVPIAAALWQYAFQTHGRQRLLREASPGLVQTQAARVQQCLDAVHMPVAACTAQAKSGSAGAAVSVGGRARGGGAPAAAAPAGQTRAWKHHRRCAPPDCCRQGVVAICGERTRVRPCCQQYLQDVQVPIKRRDMEGSLIGLGPHTGVDVAPLGQAPLQGACIPVLRACQERVSCR